MAFAFFDVDTQWGDPARQCLLLRVHLKDMAPIYNRLAEVIGESGAPVVATLCLQSPGVDLTTDPKWVWIPQEGDVAEWEGRVPSARRFILEKRACGTPAENVAARAHDVFHSHPHATRLIDLIGIKKWFVFGRSEICVETAIQGLRAAGCEVIVIGDAVAPGSRGTAETVRDFLAQCGAELMTVEELAASLEA